MSEHVFLIDLQREEWAMQDKGHRELADFYAARCLDSRLLPIAAVSAGLASYHASMAVLERLDLE